MKDGGSDDGEVELTSFFFFFFVNTVPWVWRLGVMDSGEMGLLLKKLDHSYGTKHNGRHRQNAISGGY